MMELIDPMALAPTVLIMALLAGHPNATDPLQIPEIDIVAQCDRAIALAGCVEAEHASLGALHFWWHRILDQDTKAYCIERTREDPFLNYTHLMLCIADKARLPHPALASYR